MGGDGSPLTDPVKIAECLVLSPRTVAAHLRQPFPELGVASRAALRDALAELPPDQP